MEEIKIEIQQAYYGEVQRAHSCIHQTIVDAELTSFLIAFTDRPAALPPGVELRPYLSGTAFSKYYIFTKTFPDPYATRAGMVFTHVLILELKDICTLNNIEDVLSFFISQIPEKRTDLNILNADFPQEITISNQIQPKYIQQILSSFLNDTLPILLSGSEDCFKNALQIIWNTPDFEYRKRIKFRTSFTPSDIEGKDLTIVSIQKEFLSKWTRHTIISSENSELIELTAPSELLFSGCGNGHPFHDFLVDLHIDDANFKNYILAEKLFNNFINLNNIIDGDALRYDIRALSKLSPNPDHGGITKESFIDRIGMLVNSGKDSNLKAFRNIEWTAFKNGETKAKQIIANFIQSEMLKSSNAQIELMADLLEIALLEENKNWWHASIQESFRNSCSSLTKPLINNLWKLIEFSDKTLINVFSLLPTTKLIESNLRENIPENLKSETITELESIAKRNKWYLLHAEILLTYLQKEKSLIKQLALESRLKFEDSIGTNYISSTLNDNELMALTISSHDEKLIALSVERILKNKSLLKKLDVSNHYWLKIWSLSLEKTNDINYGIESNVQCIIFSVLDLILQDIPIQELIIQLIANSELADISNYGMRANIWNKIPSKYLEKFLDATSKNILTEFLYGHIEIHTIEKELIDKITSYTFMSNFLNQNKNNFDSVIKIYSNFPNLNDELLSHYISNYSGLITEAQSKQLGDAVHNLKFSKTARSISDKSKSNTSFKVALAQCNDLIPFSILDLIINPFTAQKTSTMPINKTKHPPTVVILTAIQEEYLAVLAHLSNINDVDKNDTVYETGTFELNGNHIADIVIRECGAKNTTASQEAERAINYFNPDMMLFVGIAGSRKPNDFKIGDVIFAEKIYSYESGKATSTDLKARPDAVHPSYKLLEKAKKERNKTDWKTLIKAEAPDSTKANIGIIASGEQLIEHINSETGKILTANYNDSAAVEMEGYGFIKATTRQGSLTDKIQVAVIRGISDIIEQLEESQTCNDRRPDNAKNLASDTAAAFAFWLIFKTYT